MSYTSFGEYVRILRIQHHEIMGDMARLLGVSSAFLSAVETGKKNVPQEWIDRIADHYQLNSEARAELSNAALESRTQYKINTSTAGISQRRAAMAFARSFDEIDDETANKLIELLNKRKELHQT